MKDRFFIFGHYGEKNTGDDAMIYALLNGISSISPCIHFSILSPGELFIPHQTKKRVRFIKPKPFQVFNEIRRSSVFIMGGGTQIYDKGNKFERLRVLSEMFMIILWAKFFCKKIYFLNIGVEPFSTRLRKFLSIKICQFADFITVRDLNSYHILKEEGINKLEISFDLAVLLRFKRVKKLVKDSRTIGVSILPYFEIYQKKKEKDIIFVDKILEPLSKWLQMDFENKLNLFIFKGKSRADDTRITQTLKEKFKNDAQVKLIEYNENPLNTLKQVDSCDLFIGMRYHSCLFAYLTETPLLVISYFHKCGSLAGEIKLSDRAVISIEDIMKGRFGEYFQDLNDNPDKFKPSLPVLIAKKRAKKFISVINNGFFQGREK